MENFIFCAVNLRPLSKGKSSRSQMFFKIGVVSNFANFTRKHLRRSLVLIKALGPAILLKRDFNTGVFLRNLRNFWEHLFYRTPTVAASKGVESLLTLLSRQSCICSIETVIWMGSAKKLPKKEIAMFLRNLYRILISIKLQVISGKKNWLKLLITMVILRSNNSIFFLCATSCWVDRNHICLNP